MEMSNIDSNLNEGMTRYKVRVTTKTYYTSDASTEDSLVHRLSNHMNYNTRNNSHYTKITRDLANELQTESCIFTTHHKANER